MKLGIQVDIEIDAEKWATEYGIPLAEVPEDVQRFWDGDDGLVRDLIIPEQLLHLAEITRLATRVDTRGRLVPVKQLPR